MALINYNIERFSDVIDEAKPLLRRHWEEIAEYKDCIPLSPDLTKYAQLEALGSLVIFTARRDGVLIGYASFIVERGLHYSTVLAAWSDIIWIDPSQRRVGAAAAIGLIDFFEAELLAIGVCSIRMRSKLSHPALSRLLSSKGYEVVETVSAKLIQRPE